VVHIPGCANHIHQLTSQAILESKAFISPCKPYSNNSSVRD
jgi:hypothetical protein